MVKGKAATVAVASEKPAAMDAEVPVLSMEKFIEELSSRSHLGDFTVQPTAAVRGASLSQVELSLDSSDAKGAFFASQTKQEEVGLEPERRDEGRNSIDFDEFCTCLALCGHITFLSVEEMSLSQRVGGMIETYLGVRSRQAVVTEAVVVKVPRFDASQTAPLSGHAGEVHSLLTLSWKAMDVSGVDGFPMWEQDVFTLLQRDFVEIRAIFTHYANSGSSAHKPIQVTELLESELASLVRDTGMGTETLSVTKMQAIHAQLSGREEGDTLLLHHFLELLVIVGLYRANPRLGEVGGLAAPTVPLPGCLDSLLTNHLLRDAKKSKLRDARQAMGMADVKEVLTARRKALKVVFEATCKARDPKSKKLFGSTIMSLRMWVDDATERRLLYESEVRSRVGVTGAEGKTHRVTLSAVDLRNAFVACQRGDGGEEGNASIDFDEFLLCLALCGYIKYEGVASMTLPQRVSGIFANYLGEKDEQAVITEAVEPAVTRYEFMASRALPGQSFQEHQLWVATWAKIDLSGLYGFPLWEEEVFKLLQEGFGELRQIYDHYAGVSEGVSTLQQPELVDFVLDVGLVTDAFPMSRVLAAFDRINLTDSRTDHDLDLDEFIWLLVVVAFYRSNPHIGDHHHPSNATKTGVSPVVELPRCLRDLLDTNLLRPARKAALSEMRRAYEEDKMARTVVHAHTDDLEPLYDGARFSSGGGPVLSERGFLRQMSEMSVTRSVIIQLPNGVDGAGSNARLDLSWLDARAAFFICTANNGGTYRSTDQPTDRPTDRPTGRPTN